MNAFHSEWEIKLRKTVLDRVRSHPKVEIVDDERDMGNGVIVTLKQGWTWDQLADNRVSGEDTPTKMLQALRLAHAFSGPYTS
jgi:hypothetical protein